MGLTRKARYVAGGHLTDHPLSMTYASVVSRDGVRLALLIAKFNNLDILAGDIQNSYLNTPTKEKVFSTLAMNVKFTRGRLLLLLELSMI